MECEFIKTLVEKESGINDIGIKSRKGKFPYYRFVYFALCRKFTPEISLQKVAKAVNLVNHATVINGLKQFDDLKDSKFFTLYNNCFESLKKGLENDDFRKFKTKEEAINYYRIQHILTTAKYHEVISKMQNRIQLLKK